MLSNRTFTLVASTLALSLAACGGDGFGQAGGGDDPGTPAPSSRSYASRIPMEVRGMGTADLQGGWIQEDAEAAIATSGRWEAFLEAAQAECGGVPTGFAIDGVSLHLDVAGGLVSAEALLTGELNLLLSDRPIEDPGAVVVWAAVSADVPGVVSGWAKMKVTADPIDLEPLYDALANGAFHVALGGEAQAVLGSTFLADASFQVDVRALCGEEAPEEGDGAGEPTPEERRDLTAERPALR